MESLHEAQTKAQAINWSMLKNRKKLIGQVLLLLYVLVSMGYIAYREWQDFRLVYAQASYERGRQDTVSQLLEQAANPNCQPFTVFNNQNQIQLVNTVCLTEKEAEKPKEEKK